MHEILNTLRCVSVCVCIFVGTCVCLQLLAVVEVRINDLNVHKSDARLL